jgi:hypothetical protein
MKYRTHLFRFRFRFGFCIESGWNLLAFFGVRSTEQPERV